MFFSNLFHLLRNSNKTYPLEQWSYSFANVGEYAYCYIFLSDSSTPSNISEGCLISLFP